MSHRTQIMLPDDLRAAVAQESARTGLSLAEIVRQALAHRYRSERTGASAAIAKAAGAWSRRELDGAAYVEQLRPGLGRRIEP
jgi:hypothetical protein